MFARQLDDDRFEAFLSFIQSLTEAAKMAPGVLIVGSLPESDAEAGGDARRRGAAAAGEGVRPRAVALAAGLGRRDLRDHPPPAVSAARRRRRAGARRDGQGVPRSLQARTRPSFRRRPRRRATTSCCGCPTRSTPSCSTGCRRTGRAWKNSSARAACCASWRTSSACCGMRRRAIR